MSQHGEKRYEKNNIDYLCDHSYWLHINKLQKDEILFLQTLLSRRVLPDNPMG